MPRSVALFAFGLLLLAAAAFWPMYLSRNWAAIDGYTHAHALLGTLWLLILVVQPVLILHGHRLAHRLAGRTSLFVALGFVLSGLLLTHFRVSRMTEAAFAKDGIYIYLPLAVAVLFAAACVLGFRWRKSAAVHARFMLSTALMLVDPVLARIMFFYLPPLPSDHLYQGISFILIAAVMSYLVNSLPPLAPGRIWYRNYCLGSVAILALFFVVPYTSAWLAFVNWFRVLPLT
ncbi:MAG TPA: hypothetical protein VMN03_01620 [Burkholderiales bacterium]|nr:hypothetical protein [Burkholderiales bacterium]